MQLMSFKKMFRSITDYFSGSNVKRALKMLVILSLAGLVAQVFAADLLEGTETALMDTLKGTGKKYLYIAECVVSLMAYITTKNVMVLIGIIIVAVFFNIMLKLTG